MRKQAESERGVLVDVQRPEDVRVLLMSVTYAWWNGVPPAVMSTLATDPDLRDASCDRIVFEKRSKIPAAGGEIPTERM
jgi:hypothetical protein